MHVLGHGIYMCLNLCHGFGLPLSCIALPRPTTVKKSIRLREEALAKEQEKAKSGPTSAEKLRKILKEEKR